MNQDIAFECRPATDKEREITAQSLRAHTEQAVGKPVSHIPFGLVAYDGERLAGSVVGKIFFDWLHLDLVWVEEGYRRCGVGRRLMEWSQAAAVKAGLSGIEVWTQSWQAPEFYRKIGYEEFAVLDDFTPGRKRHAFRRYLKAPL